MIKIYKIIGGRFCIISFMHRHAHSSMYAHANVNGSTK